MSPVIIERKAPFHWQNSGTVSMRYNTRKQYAWTGLDPGADSGMFHLNNCREPVFESIDIFVMSPLTNVFYMENTGSAGSLPMTRPTFRDVRVFCQNMAGRAFYHAVGNGENNEHGLYDNVTVYDYREAAWTFQGQQSKAHRLNNVRCGVDRENPSRAAHAVECYGSMQINGFSAYGHRISDILIGAVVDSIVVRDVDSESSGSVLIAPNFSGDAQPITIQGGSIRTDRLTAAPYDYVIDVESAGPLYVSGLQIGSGNQPIGKIKHTGSRTFVAGNSWGSFGSFGRRGEILNIEDYGMRQSFELANAFED